MPPEWKSAFSCGMLRATARMRPHASSVVDPTEPDVPHTVTSCFAAASRSIDALRIPVVTSSLSFGSRSNSHASNGVRSRIATMMSNSASAFTSASRSSMCSLNTRVLTCPPSGLQSATLKATF